MLKKNRVYVTHFDVVTCAGFGIDLLWRAILAENTCISFQSGFLPNQNAAIGIFNLNESFDKLLKKCVERVVIKSGIDVEDTILMVGSSVGGMQNTEKQLQNGKEFYQIDPNQHTIVAVENMLRSHFKFKSSFGFSTACTSSANALGFGYECIKKGIYSKVLIVGADAISHTTVCGFNALGVLSKVPSKPFDISHAGMNVSEGIGVVLLENKKTEDSIELLGVGYSCDAYHMTHPKPDGGGAQLSMLKALHCAKLTPKSIDYINAHGTGTEANDTTEAFAIEKVFSADACVSSTKGVIGHPLGAAGAIEAIITCQAIKEQYMPANVGLDSSNNNICNFVKNGTKKDISYAMSNSFAFGGNNTSLIFGK